jgi:hypothetical protein
MRYSKQRPKNWVLHVWLALWRSLHTLKDRRSKSGTHKSNKALPHPRRSGRKRKRHRSNTFKHVWLTLRNSSHTPKDRRSKSGTYKSNKASPHPRRSGRKRKRHRSNTFKHVWLTLGIILIIVVAGLIGLELTNIVLAEIPG